MLDEDQVIDTMEENSIFVQDDNRKVHPWRICPIGQHYVKTHSEHIHPGREHPAGQVIIRHAHCANNPSHKNHNNQDIIPKDILSFEELQMIAKTYFLDLKGLPKSNVLEFTHADEFDSQIRGWVLYWNQVFNAKDPLDPNLVKALIASESSFNSETEIRTLNGTGVAHGLMQLTDDTLDAISGRKVDLKDSFVQITPQEAMDPTANICAGVRWLFMKYAIARERITNAKLDREATWDDAVAEYKGILKSIIESKNSNTKEMIIFRNFYRKLSEER
ncbi:MAG TPA: transglycosylase SLT domain-containing protein [Gammaproteobacteria bacterium]|jgi:hypothetical protein|nr:transglycosylase SLT domain-containing protein [Gammaproteobacteria bacterium]